MILYILIILFVALMAFEIIQKNKLRRIRSTYNFSVEVHFPKGYKKTYWVDKKPEVSSKGHLILQMHNSKVTVTNALYYSVYENKR